MKLLLATGNAGKLREVRSLLAPEGIEVVGLAELDTPVEIVEDGETFVDNARKKAKTLHAITGLAVLADDSGLMVDALGGRPGIHSARYAGEHADDAANNVKLLQAMQGVDTKERSAAFVCAMVFIGPDGLETVAEGRLEGEILSAPQGEGGFGYDPVFRPRSDTRDLAQLLLEEKNQISHRHRALLALLPAIKQAS